MMSEEPPISRLIPGEAEELSGTIDSMPSFAIGELDSEQGVVLKDWSAQDFANIYVRFRPLLISHARKFLKEEFQAEEVVQDAFLYLMTALPELDSELGVLRFLKWKTKMLCLDILRASTSGLNASLVPLLDEVADKSDLDSTLERADDAAIIRMALAKLTPRHREALIATLYEEKSYEEVARQMGVGQNAFRQLLHRARLSFKEALVGEADVAGKQVSEILSIAYRRARGSSSVALGAILTSSLLVGSFLFLGDWLPNEPRVLSGPITVGQSQDADEPAPPYQPRNFEPTDKPIPQGEGASLPVELPAENKGELSGSADRVEIVPTQEAATSPRPEGAMSRAVLSSNLGLEFADSLANEAQPGGSEFEDFEGTVTIHAGTALSVYVGYDMNSEAVINHLSLIYRSPIGLVTAVPTNSLVSVSEIEGNMLQVHYVATDLIFGDLGGSYDFVTVEDAPIRRSGIQVNLVFSSSLEVVQASLSVVPRA